MATFRTTFVKNWATLCFNSGNTAHQPQQQQLQSS